MKTIKQILLTIAVLLYSLTANAYDFEVDGIYYDIISMEDLTVEVAIGDNSYSGEVIIPEIVVYGTKVLKVTSIGAYAFSYCNLTSITIPNSVTTIEHCAFSRSRLTSVIIGNSVTSIGDHAFSYCNLTSIEIPNSVTSIGNSAFESCLSLTNIVIGNSVTSIGAYAFSYCNLTSIIIPNSVTTIEHCAFLHSSLTSVIIGNSVTSIGNYAFSYCNLTSIEIPNSVTSIGNSAFEGCDSLKELRIENGTETLSLGYYGKEGLFRECPLETLYIGRNLYHSINPFEFNKTLTYVTIGNNVTNIGEYAFSNCSSLTSVIIGNSVTNIGEYAFHNCTSLTSITIPNSVTTIEDCAFYGCSGLENIYIMAPIPPYVGGSNFTNKHFIHTILHVPYGSLATYQDDITWKNFWNIEEFYIDKYFYIRYFVDNVLFETDSIKHGSEIVLIDEPTKEGYTFSGWSEAPETMPAEDIEITGSFSVNTYVITYIVDGEVYATDSLAYGSEIVLIDKPTKEGHTFSGWSEAPETMPAYDVEITGSFSVNTYAITYIVDGEVYATEELTYGSEIVLIDEPTKEGYTFSGWSEAPETMPANDIEITGSFIPTENVSEVEFDANIQTTNNGIILLNANNNWVRVYAINGILVKKIDNYTGEEITLNKGVYIVSVGNKAIKIML